MNMSMTRRPLPAALSKLRLPVIGSPLFIISNPKLVIAQCQAGIVGAPFVPAYVAAKHGVVGLTKAAALEYARQGIRVNAVCPGMIDTPMAAFVTKNYDPKIVRRMVAQEPIGRFGEPEEIAAAVVWLCSPAASFVAGHAMAVDGGILAG